MAWVTRIKKQIFVWFDTVSQHLGLNWHRSTRRHYKAIQFRPYSSVRCRILYCPRSCEKSISYFIFDQFSIFQGAESIYRITLVFWNCWKQSSLSPITWAAIPWHLNWKRKCWKIFIRLMRYFWQLFMNIRSVSWQP